MARSLIIVAAATGVCCCVDTQVPAQYVTSADFPREFQKRCVESTCRLWIHSSNGSGSCSGSIVGTDDEGIFVASAPHCFDNAPQQIVVETFGSRYPNPDRQYDEVRILCEDPGSEFALLHVRGRYRGPTLRLAPRGYMPTSGESVMSIGCGGGAPPTPKVTRLLGHDQQHFATLERGIRGRSGGPLISKDGFVLGCCCCTDGRLSFYSFSGRMHRTLDRAGLTALYQDDNAQPDQRIVRNKPDPIVKLPECPQCIPRRRTPVPKDVPAIVTRPPFPFGDQDVGNIFSMPTVPTFPRSAGSREIRIGGGQIIIQQGGSRTIRVGPDGIFINGQRIK